MIAIDQAKFDRDVKNLEKILNQTVTVLKKDMPKIIRQASIFALQSAIAATPPGRTTRIKTLAQKYRFRPLVDMPESAGFWYATPTGARFKVPRQLSKGEVKKRGLVWIKKGIKYWDHKAKQWAYRPWIGGRDLSKKVWKIPFAGAAKAGWIAGYRKLNGPKPTDMGDNSETRKPYTVVTQTPTMTSIENLVKYLAKVAPQSAAAGIHAAEAKMRHTYMPAVERRIERDWEKNVGSFVKGLESLL